MIESVRKPYKPCMCVTSVTPTMDYLLKLTFSDGKQSVFDFKPMLKKPIYSALLNIALFMKAETDGCGVVWNDDIDIDPTYLYEHSV